MKSVFVLTGLVLEGKRTFAELHKPNQDVILEFLIERRTSSPAEYFHAATLLCTTMRIVRMFDLMEVSSKEAIQAMSEVLDDWEHGIPSSAQLPEPKRSMLRQFIDSATTYVLSAAAEESTHDDETTMRVT